ncbi:MAG TPA: hypothetical protein VE422_20600 [Terriglobia bacterium]|nr:hypothetical protein [Terriglobia bacterium]
MAAPQRKRYSASTQKRARLASAISSSGFESEAEKISARIREKHMPHGTLMDPIFASPDSEVIDSYTRTGDSAIWTGHYLAAEAFRYRVTGSADALANATAAIVGIRGLVDITGMDVLARVAVPANSPYAAAIQKEEGGHGVFAGRLHGQDYFWIGNTTRDQYSGVIFGLGVALEMLDETPVQGEVAELVGRLVGYLVDHSWAIRMPTGKVSTVFLQRPDQQLAFLQVAKRAASGKFSSRYRAMALAMSALTLVPIAYELLDDHHSYFKFNLDTINLYSLLRFENKNSLFRKLYLKAYDVLRRTTDDHQNAHFNMIDCAVKGRDSRRDQQTMEFLEAWLQRPRRDPFVDLRGTFKARSEDRASTVIPIPQRPTTDFLWQRSPFLLYGGGVGLVEGAGIDFILPYWMARFFGVA